MSQDQNGKPGGRGGSFVRRERPDIPTPSVRHRQHRQTLAHQHRRHRTGGDEHARLVVPRQQRSDAGLASAIELREVRLGASGTPYLRVVPKAQRLRGVAPGHIEATQVGSRPRGPVSRALASLRKFVLGRPFATSQAIHERLSKLMALPVFASDALSSSAYATEEILLVLVLAGTGSLTYSLPIAAVIGVLLVMVAISYRQTIKAYPNGGGAYIVARENLGSGAGLTAAGALLVDYVLTVSVSVAAGVAAVTSAVPDLHEYRVEIAVGVVGIVTLANLRGVRESGAMFAGPTYFFIAATTVVIALGFIKIVMGDAPGTFLHAGAPQEQHEATQGLGLFLVLKAFSSGCAALTGIEAISNGVPAFKKPEADNARTTLAWMAAILLFLFLGITFLTSRFGFVPSHEETIISQLGREVLGKNVAYYGFQVGTALVLFLAANTAYADFPRLSAILARDGYMPRQFNFRGDRLAFSNGILALAVAASALLVVFGATVSNLIPLYAVGVFASFTLSQLGMVVHWWRLREPGWKASLVVNGVGAIGTGVVTIIIGGSKFIDGAWLSLVMMGTLVLLFILIQRHYKWFARQVSVPSDTTLPIARTSVAEPDQGAAANHVIVPVDSINKITLGAVAMAREIGTRVTAVHLTDDREEAQAFREQWARAVPDVPLLVVESPYRSFVEPMLAYIESVVQRDPRVTVVLPAFVAHRPWQKLLHNRDIMRLKPYLKQLGVRSAEYRFDVEAGATAAI